MSNGSLTSEQVVSLLAMGPGRIDRTTQGLTEDQLHTTPGPVEWSANDVLAHLRACADVWGDCMRRIAAEDRPTLRAVNPRTWIEKTDYLQLGFRPSLDAFAAQRAEVIAFLERLTEEAWCRSATVTGAGKTLERTVLFYARWMATHERPHIKQIERIAKTISTQAWDSGRDPTS